MRLMSNNSFFSPDIMINLMFTLVRKSLLGTAVANSKTYALELQSAWISQKAAMNSLPVTDYI